jgi:gliding motility-associated lipoprotein GldD
MEKMIKNTIAFSVLSLAFLLVCGCKDDVLPKPAAQLRLDYPIAKYFPFATGCPFTFDVNSDAIVKQTSDCNLTIDYPKMKATIYLSYKPVQQNINKLLRDAQKLTYEHVIKADNIIEQPFVNQKDRVFGMFYRVDGNAATNGQFYVTDSTSHFIDCSVYFYAKPNFDSVMPAASYVKNDMRKIMETLKWK